MTAFEVIVKMFMVLGSVGVIFILALSYGALIHQIDLHYEQDEEVKINDWL